MVEKEREASENVNEEEGGSQETDGESYATVEEVQSEVDAGGSLDDSEDYGHEAMQAVEDTGTEETLNGVGQVSDRKQRQRNAAEAQKAKNKMFHFF